MNNYANSPQQNALQQWLDFYDRQMPAMPRSSTKFGGGDTSGLHAKQRLDWAMQQSGMGPEQGKPDFFGEEGGMSGGVGGGMSGGMGGGAAFVKPERFNDPMPVRQPMANPMRGDIENYLAKFLRGR